MVKFSLKSEKLLFWLTLGLMVFIPLYPKFPLLNIPKTYVAIRVEDILIAVLLIIWIHNKLPKMNKFFSPKIKAILKEPITQSFLLFWLIGGLSLLSAILITHTILPHLGLLHWVRRVEYMVLFLIAATTISSFEQVKIILKTGIIATLAVAFYGFGQVLFKFPVISTTNREFSKGLILFLSPEARVNSTFAGHYDLAVFLSIVLVLMASLFFSYKKIWHKGLIALAGLLSFILLGMTAARVSFVATLAALSLSFWLNSKKILILLMFLAALGAVALIPDLRHRLVATFTVNILGGGGPKYNLPKGEAPPNLNKLSESSKAALFREVVEVGSGGASVVKVPSDVAPGEPLNITELGVSRSYGIRFDVEWPRALRAFYKNPFLGTGYSSLTIATDNDLLRSLGEVGLLGTLSLLTIFFVIIKRMIKFIRSEKGMERSFIIGVFCTIVAVLITGLFIDVLEASKVATIFWFLLGVAWAVISKYELSSRK